MHAIDVVKCLLTNTTATNTSSTHDALTKVTANSLVTCVTVPLRNATASAYTFYTCTRNIAHISVTNAESVFHNLQAWTNIFGCTVEKGLTSVHTVVRRSLRRQFWGRTSASTVEKNHLNVGIAGKLLHLTLRMIVTWDARIPRRNLASVSFVVKLLHNLTNWNSTWTCIRVRSRTRVRSVGVASQVLRHVIGIGRTLTARRERIEHPK